MVRARLHLICGICGCNNEWEWRHSPKEIDEDDGELLSEENVYLYCNNCSTIHSINDNARRKFQPVIDKEQGQ